jgi:hypothetical protein
MGGSLNPGECMLDSECPEGRSCEGTSEGPACVAPDCFDDSQCGADGYCYRAECVRRRERGDECGWEHRCREGLQCVFGHCADVLRRSSRCDGKCDPPDRICFTDDDSKAHCVAPPVPCSDGRTVCDVNEKCSVEGDAGTFSCIPRGHLLDRCAENGDCAVGYECFAGACTTIEPATYACKIDADCVEGMFCAFVLGQRDMRGCYSKILPLQSCDSVLATSDEALCVQGFRCDAAAGRCEPLVMPECIGGCGAMKCGVGPVKPGQCVQHGNR